MPKAIIDRFEGEFAIVELPNKDYANLPKKLLPKTAREGDVISIEIDAKETRDRTANMQELKNKVWEK